MKILALLAVLSLGGVIGWQQLQITEMRQEVDGLRQKLTAEQRRVAEERENARISKELQRQAAAALQQVRTSVAEMKPEQARTALQTAKDRIDALAGVVAEKGAPAVQWLKDQVAELGHHVDSRLGAK
jgi:uncharacterized protein HemX